MEACAAPVVRTSVRHIEGRWFNSHPGTFPDCFSVGYLPCNGRISIVLVQL